MKILIKNQQMVQTNENEITAACRKSETGGVFNSGKPVCRLPIVILGYTEGAYFYRWMARFDQRRLPALENKSIVPIKVAG
jgi:hypothetical protein